MNIRTICTIAAALALIGCAAATRAQQSPAAPAAHHGPANVCEGTVTNVSGSSFTIMTRNTNQSVTVNVLPKTHYTLVSKSSLSTIASGDDVLVAGKVDATNLTVEARIITLVKSENGKLGKRVEQSNHGIVGTVASTSPNLTVTTTGGATYTVNLSSRTEVVAHQPGTASDIASGKFVRVNYVPLGSDSGGATTVTARSIIISDTAPHGPKG
jgi:hypothetical protein